MTTNEQAKSVHNLVLESVQAVKALFLVSLLVFENEPTDLFHPRTSAASAIPHKLNSLYMVKLVK